MQEYMMNTPFLLSWSTNKGFLSIKLENLCNMNVFITRTISFSPCSFELWRLNCNTIGLGFTWKCVIIRSRHLQKIVPVAFTIFHKLALACVEIFIFSALYLLVVPYSRVIEFTCMYRVKPLRTDTLGTSKSVRLIEVSVL